MDPNRQQWNERQQILRDLLESGSDHPQAIRLFLTQHAMLHDPALGETVPYNFEAPVWDGLSDLTARRIPKGEEHSIVWNIWHLARIEDVTMNVLVGGKAQLFSQLDWQSRLKATTVEVGNAMDESHVIELSARVDIQALREYRLEVARHTREVVRDLQPSDTKQKVDPSRLERVLAEGSVQDASRWLIDYWGSLTICGLLLMPPTRHCFVHLNECMLLKKKRS